MSFINFISNAIIPIVITIIMIYALLEKVKIFDNFIIGAKEGMEMVIGLFPTLIGLFVAVGALRSSGIIDGIIKIFLPIINLFGFPKEIIPLAILRPISRKCINCNWY